MTEIGAFSSTGGREEEAGHDAGAEGEAAGGGDGRRWRLEENRLGGEWAAKMDKISMESILFKWIMTHDSQYLGIRPRAI